MAHDLSRRDVLAATAALAASCGSPICRIVSDERDTTLRALLARNREWHPVYGGGLANHLSMELCALFALGAPAERMEAFSASYSRRLEPFPESGEPVTRDTWRGQLGRKEALHGFAAFFSDELRERGREPVLREVLAVLAPSLSSELFHCLIRTAYGARFADDDEIAHGLAYWSIESQTLGTLAPQAGRERDFAALLARARATPALAHADLTGNSNPGRMQQASRLDGFADVVNEFEPGPDALDRLGRAVLALYAATSSFTALHAVTSTHALRVLLPYFPDPEAALRYQAQALIAAYVRMGAPEFEARPSGDVPTWEAIGKKAIASDDDHDAKFVFACREEQSARGDELYRGAAALRVRTAVTK